MEMLFLAIITTLVVSTPQYFGLDEFANEGCTGEKLYSEYSFLGLCRHFKDHSEKTTYHSVIQAEASLFDDNDCSGLSKDYFIDLGCHRVEHEFVRHHNYTYFDNPPKGNLEQIYTTDSTCSTDFEGGLTFYPKQGECTRNHHRTSKTLSFMYTCNSTFVTKYQYIDPVCKVVSHQVTHPIGCHKSEGTENQYVLINCVQ